MPIPANLDFDKLATIALTEITTALRGWLNGRPADEVALMNRVTERLSRNRRGCDVGAAERVRVVSQLAMLHRQGPKQTDLYGSDLGVTVVIDDLSFIKTALLQFKKGTDFKADLEIRQLNQAAASAVIEDRSFVMYADEGRTGIRLHPVAALRRTYSSGQQRQRFDTTGWTCLTRWLWDWLSCDVGPPSAPNDPNGVEPLLQKYVIEDDWISAWGEAGDNGFLDDVLPARAWLVLYFVREGSDSALAAKLK